MGTRSTTKIYRIWKDEKGKEHKELYLALYKQYDGDTGSWGKHLKEFINKGVWVNGLNETKGSNQFNGIGDFALLLVKEFKDGSGGLYATSSKDKQQYNYVITYISDEYKSYEAVLRIECEEDKSFNQEIKFTVK